MSEKNTSPVVRPRLAGDDVHHRGLARAIGADNRAKLARIDDEGQAVQRLEAIERDRDIVEIEQALGAFFAGGSSGSAPLQSGLRQFRLRPLPNRSIRSLGVRTWSFSKTAAQSVPTMPLWQEQGDGDEQAAEREQPEGGEKPGEDGLAAIHQDRADDRPDQRRPPADRRPYHHFDGVRRVRIRPD